MQRRYEKYIIISIWIPRGSELHRFLDDLVLKYGLPYNDRYKYGKALKLLLIELIENIKYGILLGGSYEAALPAGARA